MVTTAPAIRRLTVRPIAGMWTDDPGQYVPEGASPDMLNFQVFQGILRKRPGYGLFQSDSTFPAGPLTGIYSAQDAAGNRRLFVTNTVGLFRFNAGTHVYDAMTGPALTGSAAGLFSFDISQNSLVFSQGVDNVMSLPLTGTAYAVINANAKPAFYLSRWNQRLFEAFTIEGGNATPFRVRWPVAADHTNWTGIGSGFKDLDDDVFQIRNIRKILDTLAVYTEKGIWLANKTGQVTAPQSFNLTVRDIGLFASYTLVGFNVTHFFLGTDNLYAFNGVQAIPIGQAVRSTIFNSMQSAKTAQFFGTLFLDTQEYGCFIYTGNNTAADTVWVYHYMRQAVYPWQFANPLFTCIANHYLDASTTIAALVGTIAAQTWVIGAKSLSAAIPLPVAGGTDGKVYFFANGLLSDNGTAILCRWTSKDYTAADIDPSLSNYKVTLSAVGVSFLDPGAAFTLQFYYSTDEGNSWTGPFPVTMGGVGNGLFGDAQATQQVTGDRVRFKFENNTTNENPQIVAVYPILEQSMQEIAA